MTEEITPVAFERLLDLATTAGYWHGCTQACLRYSNHPRERCEATCHQLVAAERARAADVAEWSAHGGPSPGCDSLLSGGTAGGPRVDNGG